MVLVLIGDHVTRLPASKVELLDKGYTFVLAKRKAKELITEPELAFVIGNDDTVREALKEAGVI